MFTDLVASTARATRVGPARSDELRREHFSLLRTVLGEYRGVEVKTLGDGVMETFESVADAVNAAVAVQQALATTNRSNPDAIEVRVGLSIGEITEDAGDAFGPAVVEAARLCADARPGQILCAPLIRPMADGHCRHTFRALGSRSLKGLPEGMAVDEVAWEPLVKRGVAADFANVDAGGSARALNVLDLQHRADLQNFLPVFGEVRRRIMELLAPTPGQTLLDVGCGAGQDVLELARMVGSGGAAFGVDKSESLLREARDRAAQAGIDNVEFRFGDAQRLPLDDDSVDGARSDRVFQYLTDPASAVRELIRVTRPGGTVVVADTDWGASVFDSDDLDLGVRIDDAWTATRPSGRIGRQLFGLFVRAGLRDVEVFPHTVAATNASEDGASELTSAYREIVLAAFARQAVDVGAVTADDASRWLALQHAAAEQGRFFRFLAMFIVRGRVAE